MQQTLCSSYMLYCIQLHITRGLGLWNGPCLSFWERDCKLLSSCINCAMVSIAEKYVLTEFRPVLFYVLGFVCNDNTTKLCWMLKFFIKKTDCSKVCTSWMTTADKNRSLLFHREQNYYVLITVVLSTVLFADKHSPWFL